MKVALLSACLILLIIFGLWILVPSFYGLPWVPTREKRIRKALQLAKLLPGEILYDLGAGDGRVLLMAVKEFGTRAVGIEIGPVQWALGGLRILLAVNRRMATIRWANFYKADIQAADVVFVYLTSSQTSRLAEKLAKELRPGARVVSIAADFPDWQPEQVDREGLIFVYQMPVLRAINDISLSIGVK